MNKKWTLVLLCLFVSLPAMATETEEKEMGFWIEAQVVSQRPSKVILWYEREITDSFGFFAFIWKESDGYREIIVGPTWKPYEGIQLGLGIGRETVPEEGRGTRRMFFFEANPTDEWNFHGSFERGRVSGSWHKITATYALSEKFGIGLMDETLVGRGPRVEFNTKIEDKKTQFWAAGLEKAGIKTLVLGVNVSF